MISKAVENILLKVQKPGRYIGGEINSVVKDIKDINIRFAFCFPDVYEVGMSHIGMKILYGLLNREPDIWCERVFAPWVDMEEQMRKNDIKLYGLESGQAITSFDFIGFTLQYELSYTNVLNMLELAGIPILSSERSGLEQFVVAGGPCVCNPEPLADFIDFFFIGEGEEITIEVMNLYREYKKMGATREQFLKEVSKIEGIYVPSLYNVEYNDDGTIKKFIPREEAPGKIRKRVIIDLDKLYYPDKFVVPLIDIVHDRAVAEIFRGCIRGCRFCQAGFIYRPMREKSINVINEQCKNLCENTGYDEISLSSLSSSDYTHINQLIDKLHCWTKNSMVSVSLPSLRVDGFSDELTSRLRSIRKGGLTFAPEAGTQKLRDVINKNVTDEELVNTCRFAFDGGWTSIKLYFMIGLPTENTDDIEGIAKLGQKVVNTYYNNPNKIKGKSVKVTVGVSSFVPKAFTPFQWEAQDSIETLKGKQMYLKDSIKTKKINLNWHDADTSFIEAVFARGDRKLCGVLKRAHEVGMRFDGWSDHFSLDKWMNIFINSNLDPHFYANRKRSFEEILPWDHIDYGVDKKFLESECKLAYCSSITKNCREKCSGCGVICFKGGVCIEKHQNMV